MTGTKRSSGLEETRSPHDRPYRRLVVPDDLVTDQSLQDGAKDEFDHAAIAKAVADLTLSSTTPVNIALFGPWGSGKSSFYNLMKRRIEQQDDSVVVIPYDAWKFGGQALKVEFLQQLAEKTGVGKASEVDLELNLAQEQSRIRLGAWIRANWKSILGAFLLAIVFAVLWVAISAALRAGTIQPADHFWRKASQHTGEFGLVMAAVLTTVLLGPQAIAASVVKTTRPAADRDDQFTRLFRKLVDEIKRKKKAHRLVIFIDELDRCEPEDVVATLVDLKTFLEVPDCVFVVAADRDVIERALRKVPQAKPVREDDPYYSTPGAFLDKIFQHQIALPPLRSHALSSFAHTLVSERSQGLWHDLRTADPSGRLFNDVIYVLIPGHVSSPRRVKVLLNNFATSARIAQSRRIDWVGRARELAFLTVLETEFPSVASLLVRYPDLLACLRGDASASGPLPDDLQRVVDLFSVTPELGTSTPSSPAPPTLPTPAPTATPADESVAGEILRDDNASVTRKSAGAAGITLARQLHDYLDKLRVVTVPDPRPDLLYLRVVGYEEGLRDPALGEMIDLAADRSPEAVVTAFSEEEEQIRALAVDLLIRQLATSRGTGLANVLESACRLAHTLSEASLRMVGHLAPEVVTHASGGSWRKPDIPGATYLLTVTEQDTSASVEDLLGQLDLTDAGDLDLLQACVPALSWAGDETAKPIHAAIGKSFGTSLSPLSQVLKAPEDVAVRAWDDLASPIETLLGSPTGNSAFETITTAILDSSNPESLMMSALFVGLETHEAALIEAIHDRRDTYMAVLDREEQIAVAAYAIEAGSKAYWPDWLGYFADPPASPSRRDSRWAQDAAIEIGRHVPTEVSDLTVAFGQVAAVIRKRERHAVFDALLESVAEMKWGDAADPEGVRWKNLHQMVRRVADKAERDRYWDAVSASLVGSIEAALPIMAAADPALLREWRDCIEQLPKSKAIEVDDAIASVTAPSTQITVEHLRLRILARRRGGGAALTARTILTATGEGTASAMAAEWLALKPTVSAVLAVHKDIPIGARPLGVYAKDLDVVNRTKLWIGVERMGVAGVHLEAIGRHGVTGDAITHMKPHILAPARQPERNAAARRLMTAAFAETRNASDQDDGEFGHKEASKLAVDLIDAGGYENVILAGRVIIHSKGFGFGTKNKLHKAFTNLANGKQRANFTNDQAEELIRIGVLTPRKRGPFGRFFRRS